VALADSGSDAKPSAKGSALLLLEISAAKEAKNERDCLGKPLGCSFGDRPGIAVRLKW